MLKISLYGDDILRHKALPIKVIDKKIRELAADMIEIMSRLDGLGLAAPQVSVSLALIVIDLPMLDDDSPDPLVLINPEIVSHSDLCDYQEGCLSLPNVFANISRPWQIQFKFQDITGNWHEQKANGILARVIQHEIDHLNGILFVDYLDDDAKASVMKELNVLAYDELYAEADTNRVEQT